MRRRNAVLGGILAFLAVTGGAFALYVSHDSACPAPPALASGVPSMQAIVYRCYGGPEVLKLEQVEKPAPADQKVLIKVKAASVNPLDWHYMRGLPYIVRLYAGVGAPESITMGVDFAGTVEAVGKDVKRYKPGDEVFGAKGGAFGEYVSMLEDRSLALKPANISFEQAASVPIAAVTALQALRDVGRVQPGQKVLINGASGGVGTFAVQIAKSYGAEVTGVCSTRNLQLVHSIGADHVIDYTREDFTLGTQKYDLILDTVGNRALSDLRRVMTPNGTAILIGGGGPNDGKWLWPLLGPVKAMAYSHFVSQKFKFMLADDNKEDLNVLADLMRTGKVTPVIDRRYPLSEVPAAMAYLEQGHARGKVVIDVP
jgi:NADPH:quinone reductase-like Zn-dependent oxidoreductase